MNFFQAASNVLRTAITDNVVDPRLQQIRYWKGDGSNLLAKVIANVGPTVQLSYSKTSWQLPETRRYAVSKHNPSGNPLTQPDAAQSWLVELARFTVPYGSIGMIKSIEQYLSHSENNWTESAKWGVPYPTGVDVSWHFRLSKIASSIPWVSTSGTSATQEYLPGIPHPDLPNTDDIWYPASSPASTHVHIIVPGGYILRAFAIVGSSQSEAGVAIRLTGSTQSETNNEAQKVIRSEW